ncbi:MAG: T9SS type A sorting domain-containing protein, partial [Bacteroidetes bacterium]
TNAAGCDSVATLHLTINSATASDTTAVVCNTFNWHGNDYTSSGNYTYTTTNVAGCDSVVTLHLTINHATASDTTAVACNTFNWHGNDYTSSGNYTYTTTNVAGCDSVVTLHLTINHSTVSDTTAVACNTFSWHGNDYTASGNYTYTTTNAAGCDSMVTLHLTISHPSSSDTTAAACSSFVWHGNTYNTSGTYTYTTTNAGGCDSVVTLHLTINPRPAAPTISLGEGLLTFCQGQGSATLHSDSVEGNQWYRNLAAIGVDDGGNDGNYTAITAGDYTVTYTGPNGCESLQSNVLTVTVNTPPVVAPITGPATVEIGLTIQLADATTGGTWVSNQPAFATVDANGVVTGVAAGTATIRYVVTNTCGTTTVTKTVDVITTPGGRVIIVPTEPVVAKVNIELTAMPNPTTSYINLSTKSNDKTPMTVRVYDGSGVAIENFQKVIPGTVLRMGDKWRGGIYVIEVVQGTERKTLKVIKTN